jgi:hypothetical protein
MDFESTEDSGSLLQIVQIQMKLVRRARYCAPIAERKHEAAEVCCHPELYDISSPRPHATERVSLHQSVSLTQSAVPQAGPLFQAITQFLG